MTQSLGRGEILRRRREVSRVLRTGTRVAGPALTLRFAPRPASRPTGNVPMNRRIAFLLGRGFGCAVERNRLKRRLRETYRRNKDWFPAGYDYILSPTPAGSGLPVARLEAETRKLTSRVPHHEPTA